MLFVEVCDEYVVRDGVDSLDRTLGRNRSLMNSLSVLDAVKKSARSVQKLVLWRGGARRAMAEMNEDMHKIQPGR